MPPLTPLEILITARALIANPAHWTQGANARDKDGTPVDYNSEEAYCFCSRGAFRSQENNLRQYGEAFYILKRAMGGNVIRYNDSHTHPEVMTAWDKAIEEAAIV